MHGAALLCESLIKTILKRYLTTSGGSFVVGVCFVLFFETETALDTQLVKARELIIFCSDRVGNVCLSAPHHTLPTDSAAVHANRPPFRSYTRADVRIFLGDVTTNAPSCLIRTNPSHEPHHIRHIYRTECTVNVSRFGVTSTLAGRSG